MAIAHPAHPPWPQLRVPAASAEPGPLFHTFDLCTSSLPPALVSTQLPPSPDIPTESSGPSLQSCHLASYSCAILPPACLSDWPPVQLLFTHVPKQGRSSLLTVQPPPAQASKSNSEAGWLGEESSRLQPLLWCHLLPAHGSWPSSYVYFRVWWRSIVAGTYCSSMFSYKPLKHVTLVSSQKHW